MVITLYNLSVPKLDAQYSVLKRWIALDLRVCIYILNDSGRIFKLLSRTFILQYIKYQIWKKF